MTRIIFRCAAALLMCIGLQGTAFAQEEARIEVYNFSLKPTDMDARVNYPVKDINEKVCALIKFETTQVGFTFDTGTIMITRTENKPGEIWVYVSPGVAKLNIYHKDYLPCRYEIPIPVRSGEVYTVQARFHGTRESGKYISDVSVDAGFLKIKSKPENFTLRLGKTQDYEMETARVENGVYTKRLEFGRYYFKIDTKFYETYYGEVELNENTPLIEANPYPAYNRLKINSSPESGATVIIRNLKTEEEEIGKTPYSSDRFFAKGDYLVTVSHRDYATLEKRISLNGDSSVQSFDFPLSAQYATVTCRCDNPEAAIWLDEEYKGKGSWTGRISGDYTHKLEARLDNHHSRMTSFDVRNGESRTVSVGAPVPMMSVLEITSEPAITEVRIDGELIGEAPMVKKLIAGSHSVEINADGYAPATYNIVLKEGEPYLLKATLTPKGYSKLVNGWSTTQAARSKQTFSINGYDFNMILVEGGDFMMGATPEQGKKSHASELPVHQVTLSDYYIGEFEVTQGLWKAVMGGSVVPGKFGQGDKLPVNAASWVECQLFITRLNKLTGITFSLPSEAQWEYAARGGNKSMAYKYSGGNKLKDVAWCNGNAKARVQAVGQKVPNELGLYDMTGNASEWCEDYWSSDYYKASPKVNPVNTSGANYRIVRGYDVISSDKYVNSSGRSSSNVYDSGDRPIGLRLVINLEKNGEPKTFDYVTKTIEVGNLDFDMVLVKGGLFTMGGETSADTQTKFPAHQVTLSDYYIGEFPVGKALWQAVMGSQPNGTDWYECNLFITKLNQMTGYKFSLPTEAQWEYAARGGNKSDGNTLICSEREHKLYLADMYHPDEIGEWCCEQYGSCGANALTDPKDMYLTERYSRHSGGDISVRGGFLEISKRSHSAPSKDNRMRLVLNLDENGKPEKYTTSMDLPKIIVNGTECEMVLVEGGTFSMGAAKTQWQDGSSLPVHRVKLSNYYIGKFEVTQELWKAVMGSYHTFKHRDTYSNILFHTQQNGDNYPVAYLSWNECQDFVKKLSELTGYKFSLPTEAQWEYAARGGKYSKGYKYSGSNTAGEVALWKGIYSVGRMKANELGIYDMSGNVGEWCSDIYGKYSTQFLTNPTGSSKGDARVVRGRSVGSYEPHVTSLETSFRSSQKPDWKYYNLGFRIVLNLDEKGQPVKL